MDLYFASKKMEMRYIRNILLLSIFIAGVFSADKAMAQIDEVNVIDYSDKQEYEIAGIEIIGAENRDRNAIKSIAALKEGQKIVIPSTDIPKAIKALMKLRLFDDVQIIKDRVEDNMVFLKIILVERPTLSRYSYSGVKRSQHEDLNDILKTILNKGGIVTEAQKNLAKSKLEEHFKEKGRMDAVVTIKEVKDELKDNSVRLVFDVNEGKKIKVEDISFSGIDKVTSRKLRKKMGNTKRKCTWFKKSKLINDDYKEDKKSIIDYYNTLGFRDAVIVNDSIWRDEETGNIRIHMDIDEGNRYYFRNISWKGNSLYTDDQLNSILGITKGDEYNEELLQSRLSYSMDGRDISTLYMDDGYLFFQVDPTEVAVVNDSIDIEMRIFEGPQATIDNVTIAGNDRTNEHVIRRELRTRPGQKFSRSDIIRSQREIINLGYFNPETLGINTPVNPDRGTVDIEYQVEERPSDQLELSAGYGGVSGLIGTLGVTFNNFSVRNIKDRSTWNPLPQGDGQKLSLRIQSNSQFYQSYNFTFTEPWLGGKKPNAFTFGGVYSKIDNSRFGSGQLRIARLFAGLGTQLKWPDDFFSVGTTLSLEKISLDNYAGQSFSVNIDGDRVPVNDGVFNNISLSQSITRSSISDPLYPRRGSRVSLTVKATPPYSLFRKEKDISLTEDEKVELITRLREEKGLAEPPTDFEINRLVNSRLTAKKFNWLEYHKWTFNTEWYYNIADKLVFMAQAKMGFLGAYNSKLGPPPFERFQLGGDGLSNANNQLTGVDIISLRGYETEHINDDDPATIYNKFTVELRYPLSLNPNSTIYFKTFLQGGNAWGSFRDYNPYDMNKSVGVGMRVFLPMFGLLGFDYGIGFDRDDIAPGSSFGEYAKFNIVLGFEPE